MIEAVGLHKSFGDTHALAGLDFDAAEGTILGMLGPNSAGWSVATLAVGFPLGVWLYNRRTTQ